MNYITTTIARPDSASSKLVSFLALASFYSTGVVRYQHHHHEIVYLLFKTFVPVFEIQTDDFYHEAISLLKTKGGLYRHGTIEEWKFFEQKLQHVLLNSYDGVFTPKEVHLHFFPDERFPVGLEGDVNFFYSFENSYFQNAHHSLLDLTEKQTVFYIHPDLIGTDYPCGVMENNQGVFNMRLYPKKLATKADFFFGLNDNCEKDIFSELVKIQMDANRKSKRPINHVFLDERGWAPIKRKQLSLERLFIFNEKSTNKSVIGLSYNGIFKYYKYGLLPHLAMISH